MSTQHTTDHEAIKRWAEERGAKPASVKRTHGSDDPGIIRLDFPGFSGEGTLEAISWDDWWRKFDEIRSRLPLSRRDGQRRKEQLQQARQAFDLGRKESS